MIYTHLADGLPGVSPLGLGTVKFGRNTGVKYPSAFDLPDDQAIVNLLSLARDLGINLLDTAPAYGISMQRLGKLLPQVPHDWVIVSKIGEAFVNDQSEFDFSYQGTIRGVEESLRTLGRDYLDAVLIHSDGDDERILREEGVGDALLELKAQGKVGATGISGKTAAGGLLALERLDIVMVTSNLEYNDERVVIERAAELGKGVLVKKALASGHLGDSATALRHVCAQSGVSSIIVGTLNPEHLKSNLETVVEALDPKKI
jgi:aryl-alcohol dehydrogenase-like predicted oxidoreductase